MAVRQGGVQSGTFASSLPNRECTGSSLTTDPAMLTVPVGRCGPVRAGMGWYELVRAGMSWYGLVRAGMNWYELVQAGLGWYELVRAGMNWYELVQAVQGPKSQAATSSPITGHMSWSRC